MYFKLLVFKMGKVRENCYDCDSIKCIYQKKGVYPKKCSLRSCPECGEFIQEGELAVRVFFQQTRKIKKLGTFLVRNNIDPANIVSTVTYHLGHYKTQHNRWLNIQAGKAGVINVQ